MFTVEERTRVRDRLLELASSDQRIAAAAIVGSLANGGGDEWSDIDLTFAVDDHVAVDAVLDDWTRAVADEFEAVVLFDLASGPTTYRVFLLASSLQVDLSFTPRSKFVRRVEPFELAFGTAPAGEPPPAPSAHELFGWAVTFAFAARACIERKRWWMAEHLITAVRDHALSLACLRRGLPSRFGKGLDRLPPDVLESFVEARARSLDEGELRRALFVAVSGLLQETHDVADIADRVEPRLRELAATL